MKDALDKAQALLDMEIPPVEAPPITEETLYHVGVSGGKDSAAVLLWMVRESGIDPAKIRASFCDIGNDHPWTIEHVAKMSEEIHPIETIRPTLDFFELAWKKNRFPSTKARFCTEHLKIEPTQEHLLALRRQGYEPIGVSGVRAGESTDRSKLPEWDFSGMLICYEWRPLIAWSLDDVLAIHKRHNFPLNPLYSLGAQRVGCWPCIMSRKAEIRTIALRFPERIDEIRAWEEKFEAEKGRYSSFFPSRTVPERFRSKPYRMKDGTDVMVCTIDDVVKWAKTGKGAKGSWEDDEPEEPITCKSGYCE